MVLCILDPSLYGRTACFLRALLKPSMSMIERQIAYLIPPYSSGSKQALITKPFGSKDSK